MGPVPAARRLALVLALVVGGCVHTQPVSLASPEGRAEVNARAARRVATLTVRGGPPQRVRGLHVGPDETTWVDRLAGGARSVPTADVVSVSFSRGRVWRGAAIGAGVGAALGVLASINDPGGLISFSPTQYVAIYGLNGILFGGAIGAGQADRYRVRPVVSAADSASAQVWPR